MFGGYDNALKLQRRCTAMVIYDSETDQIRRYERVHAPGEKVRLTHAGQMDTEATGHWATMIWSIVVHPPEELAV